ncbi:unnamed protein product [Brassica oleracea]
MGQEEEGEGEGSIPIAVSGLIDSCHGVRELQGRSYPYSLLHSWFHHSPRANSAPQSCRARRTHASIADLENEKQSHEKKLEQFLRKASEERAAWWSREHEKQCGKWTHELLLHNSPPCSRTKPSRLLTELSSPTSRNSLISSRFRRIRASSELWERLQAEMDGKDSRVLSLRKTLSEAQKSNSKLSKRLSENSSDVVLSVRVYESMLRDVMKAASYVHPEVDYAEKGHYSNMDQREAVLSSWRSLSTFYESFLAMASSVWTLQKLALSFDPVVEIFQVESGVDFSIVFMEDVLRRKQDKKLTVNLTRGKVVGFTVIQSQVYLTSLKLKLFQWTSQQDPSKQTQCFTYRELATATNNFRLESMTGHGGFGSVFKGKLEFPPGQFKNVAVKMLDTTGHQGDKEFLVEVLMLSLLRHEHLVTLFGYCAEGEESSFKLIAKRGKLDNLNPRNA